MGRLGNRLILGLICVLLAGCGGPADPDSLRDAKDTLVEVGKRLGNALAPEDLTRNGGDESKLLRLLTSSERLSLGGAYLRFRVDQPVQIDVAVPGDRVPFWLADSRFEQTGRIIDHPDGPFRVWSRGFDKGVVGLGVNALDRRARGHYVVLVRGSRGTPAIEGIHPHDCRVVPVQEGVGPYKDDACPFDAIPAEYRDATLIQTRRDRADASALVRGKVWKTRLPSRPEADQIVVSFGDDPSRSLVWTWRTDLSVGCSSVEIERADAAIVRGPVETGAGTMNLKGPDTVSSGPLRFEGTARTIVAEGLLNDPAIYRHVVAADGLEPDTSYRYAVSDGSKTGWSPWKTARTAPASDRDYAFLAMGDPQCGLEEWGKLLHAAHARRGDAGFLLIAGDLVDRGNERGNWDHFFLRAAGVFEELPLMPCVGNHEYLDRGPVIFSESFRLPTNGPAGVPNNLTYSFEYSDSFVAVLDSNPAVYSSSMASRQAAWLEDRIRQTKARWKFVVFHHPIYPSHPSREQPQLAEAWVPVFDRNKVDMVLQGHDHAYLRTYPMFNGRAVSTPREGTIYVVSVSGQKFVPQADRPYTARGFTDVATYQTIDISTRRGTLLYRAYDLEGRELDRLQIDKSAGQPLAGRPEFDPDIRRSAAP